MALEFPFAEIGIAQALSTCPNSKELIEKCPEIEGRWKRLGQYFVMNDFTKEQISTLKIAGDDEEEILKKLRFIYCVTGDYSFKAQDKWKIVGWLFSFLLSEFPDSIVS